MRPANLKTKLFLVVKWTLVAFFFFMLIGLLMDKAYISSSILLFLILLILPPLSNFWKVKMPFLRNKWIKSVMIFVLFIIAFMINPNFDKYSNLENKAGNTRSSSKTKEMKFEKKKDIIINYIKTDTSNKSIQNIRYLEKIGDLFGIYSYSTENPQDGYISEYKDSISQKKLLLFKPDYDFLKAKLFLKADRKEGEIQSYIVLFDVDNFGKIVSEKTIIAYTKAGKMEYTNNKVPDIKTFIDENTVTRQKEISEIEQKANERKKVYEEKKAKFEEDCLSSWDGSDVELVRYVKDNMNDPKSFEHIETRYKVMDDYAIVIMRFRGKNAYGALIINTITARVSLEDCSKVEIIN